MSESTETTILLTAREIAQHCQVSESAFNAWKRSAEAKHGRQFGKKEGKARYFTQEEITLILESRNATAPKPAPYEVDYESSEDSAALAIRNNSSALVRELQSVVVCAVEQEKELAATVAKYLAPSSRRARILTMIADKLQEQGESDLEIAFTPSFEDKLLPPSAFI